MPPQRNKRNGLPERRRVLLELPQQIRLRFGLIASALLVSGLVAASGFDRVENQARVAMELMQQRDARAVKAVEAVELNAHRSRDITLGATAIALLLAALGATQLSRRLVGPLRAIASVLEPGNLREFSPRLRRSPRPVEGAELHDDLGRAARAAERFQVEAIATAQRLDSARRESRELTRVNDELEGFVRAVSHDLKAPLATSAGFIRMALDELDGEDPAGARMLLERTSDALGRADQLVVDLLELARSSDGGTPEPIELRSAVQRALEDLEGLREERRAAIQLGQGLGIGRFDPRALHQVLSNVLGNAIKYGGSRPRIRVTRRVEETSGRILLLIIDHGPGIPPEDRERIFDPFHRLQSGQEGSGLGLSLVGRAMAGAGGRVHVEETPGGGATFVLEIPEAPTREMAESDARGAKLMSAHES